MKKVSESLQRENEIVLSLLQASLGLISRDIAEIAVEVSEEKVRIYFAVRADNAEVREDIDDIAFELSVLIDPSADIETQVDVGGFRADWQGRSHRPVYLAKYEEWED